MCHLISNLKSIFSNSTQGFGSFAKVAVATILLGSLSVSSFATTTVGESSDFNAMSNATWKANVALATQDHIDSEFDIQGIAHTSMKYTAQQGVFAISLPSSSVFVMPVETTVENIAIFLASLISKNNQLDVVVKAYEGLNKGAFGKATFRSAD